MYARVATFEGGETAALREGIDEIKEQGASGPPEGVPAVGFLLLVDWDSGKTVAISLFETEADLTAGDAALSEMSPPPGMGSRTSLETYEVGAKFDA